MKGMDDMAPLKLTIDDGTVLVLRVLESGEGKHSLDPHDRIQVTQSLEHALVDFII